MKGRKDDQGKLQWSLLPWAALRPVVQVLMFGAEKYGVGNWKHVPNPQARYWNAAMRHMLAWWTDEKNDPETGQSHLAHAVCCLLFLLAQPKSRSNGRPN